MAMQSADNLTRYLAEIREYDILTREEENRLALAAQDGCQIALNRLVEANLRFVVKVAKEYRNCGLPLEDMINEGNLGLIEAAKRFDPERGPRFISCAVWWIRREILNALSNQSHAVRLPASQTAKMKEVRRTREQLAGELGRTPTDDEISSRLHAKPGALDPIHVHGVRLSSLDAPLNDDQSESFADFLVDEHQASVEEQMMKDEALACVDLLTEELEDRERDVIESRFGLGDRDPQTLQVVADRIGLSREGVRLVERKAFGYMAKRMNRDFFAPRRSMHMAQAS